MFYFFLILVISYHSPVANDVFLLDEVHLPIHLLSVQMHENKVEVYTSVQVHMREVAGLEQFPTLTCIQGPW